MQRTAVIWISSLCCVLAMVLFLNLRMPFYMGDQDPAYRYLAGFVDLASLQKTHFADHPGLPLQLLGAALIRATYSLSGTADSLLEDVLIRPELYLAVVAWTLLGLVAFSIHILGITALKVHGSLTGALMLQICSVLVSRFMIYRLVGVTATAMLLGLTFLLMSLIIRYVHAPYPERLQIKWPLLFILLLGAMVMTKFTVLPLIVIPVIILSSWKSRVCYLAGMILIAFLLMLFFVNDPERFCNLVWRVVTRSEIYGGGNVGWDLDKSVINVLRIVKSDPLFVVFLTFLIGILVKSACFGDFQGWSGLTKNMILISIVAICCASLGEWIVVVKQYRQYYLLPGSLMAALGIYLYWIKWYSNAGTRKIAVNVGLVAILLLLMLQIPMMYSWASWRRDFKSSCRKIEKHIQNNYPGKPFVVTARSAITMSYALRDFSRFYSDRLTADYAIKKIYPNETAIYRRNGRMLVNVLAESFFERPLLVIVNNKTDSKKLKGVFLSFRGKFHSIFVLDNQMDLKGQR